MVRTQADDDSDRKLLADVDSHGWHLVAIRDAPDDPPYVFSVGIYHTLGQPELCIFGLSSANAMGTILNGIGELMRGGETFQDWHESEDVLEGYACMFRRVDPRHYAEYFGYARWFHESDDFPMLQCVWPDREGRFPWDPMSESNQLVLAEQDAWPFNEGKNRGVFTTRQVIEEGHPVLVVSHDEDDDWQFLCGTTDDPDDARLVALSSVVESHPTVAELAGLPLGWQAYRNTPGDPWQREQAD